MLAKEVKEKQELISALGKEKHSLTKKLRTLLKEIKHKRHKIKAQIQAQTEAQTEAFLSGEPISAEPILKPIEKEEEKVTPHKEVPSLDLSRKGSRNAPITASASQEVVKGKSVSQHPTPRTIPESTEKEQKKEPLQIGQVFEQHEQRVAILQKDREIFNAQYKRLTQKVGSLKAQLDEALQETTKCSSLTS